MSATGTEEFDYVIVGGGSAGAILAARLSEKPDVSVCLLEAGPRDKNPFIHLPAGFIKVIFDSKVTWGFETEPGPYIDNRKLPVLQGKVLELAAPTPRFSLTVAAGARLSIDHPLSGGAGFFAALDAMVVPLRALVAVDQVPVWEGAPVAGRLSVGVSFGTRDP